MKKLIILVLLLVVLVGCEKTEPMKCPSIDIPSKFFPIKGDNLIDLDASKIKLPGGYKIAPSEKQVNPFTSFGEVICKEGKEAGENINNIYCDQLMLQKTVTNDDGDIIEQSIIGVQFVFDENHKLVETECFN